MQQDRNGSTNRAVERKKDVWPSAPFAAILMKLVTIVVTWAIIVVDVVISGGATGAVVYKCSKRADPQRK